MPLITAARTPRLLLLTAAALLQACASFPKDGPLRSEVVKEAQAPKVMPFAVVPVTANTLGALATPADGGFAAAFDDTPVTEPKLAIGDGVSLAIFEAGSEPLFGTTQNGSGGTRGVTLPELMVGLDGSITVPYAGRMPAAGLTARELGLAVQKALTGRAAQPQVLATITRGAGNAVTVLGEIGAGARVPLTARGERLLDVLAESGGLRGSIYDTWIELTRDGRSLRQPLSRILASPRDNLRLRGGDTIVVTRRAETFTVFGATGRSAQIEFGAPQVSLAEALAKSGGLSDARADPRGVFLFRYEPAPVAGKLGASGIVHNGVAPVVYQFDFLSASSYFLSQKFMLKNQDVLYVANARTNEIEKFLQLIGLFSQPVISGVVVGNTVK